ncbi:MAG: hypothetical protein PHP70_01240 [Gallionella sp.]|nr:hypothetical protein [Gallionella sp.]
MIEYIFFDANLQNKFVEYAAGLGVAAALQDDPMGLVVAIPEDIGEDVEDALEECYSRLQEEQSDLLAQAEGGLKQLAGFRYTMPDGQSRMVPLPTDTASRLLSVFSLEEVQVLFEAVARNALSCEEKTLCQILAEDGRSTAC